MLYKYGYKKTEVFKDKTNIMIVCHHLQMKNIDLSSNLKLDQTDISLATKLKNLGVVFDDNLTLKYQVAAVKKRLLEVL